MSDKMSDKLIICCLKDCSIKKSVDDHIDVKTIFPKLGFKEKIQKEFLINWRCNGEAEFHIDCWEKVSMLSRSKSKKILSPCMTKEEKALVKIAAEAPEQFDSNSKILQEAERAAAWVKSAKYCVAFTGAGISTSAGIGDYRGKAGKWTEEDQNRVVSMDTALAGSHTDNDEPPCKKSKQETSKSKVDGVDEEETEDGIPYEKLRPTYTHEALQKLMEAGYLKYVISQNGDGLHGLSGIDDDNISELHGNVFIEVCEKCERRYSRKYYVMDDVASQYFEEVEDFGKSSVRKPKHAMKCDLCGLSHRTGRRCENKRCKGFLKDTIINFRDNLEEDILARARASSRRSDVMLCLGTTLQVTPAADLVSKRKNRNKLIICNRQETPLDDQFHKKGPNGTPIGGRVFGDCDVFMKEMMQHIFPVEELVAWDAQRQERMKKYDKERD